MLEQCAADSVGDRVALLVRVPVGRKHGDPFRRNQIAQGRNHRLPAAGNVRVQQNYIRPGGCRLAGRGLTRRQSDDETVAGEVVAERLGRSAVLTDYGPATCNVIDPAARHRGIFGVRAGNARDRPSPASGPDLCPTLYWRG